jgi:hypothetical protein
MNFPEMEISEFSPSPNPLQNKNLNEIKQAINSKGDGFEMQKSEFQSISLPRGYNQNFQQTNNLGNISQEKFIPESRTVSRVESRVEPRMASRMELATESRTKGKTKIESNFEKEEDDEVNSKYSSKKEPVYVRLDKFETTLDAFREIKIQVNEIEKLLSKSKEIKAEEEKELEEWEKEIHIMKSKLESIDKNLFSRFN